MRRGNRHKDYDTSSAPLRGGLRRRVVGWLSIALLAVNVFASVALPPSPAMAAIQGPLDADMEICSIHGMTPADQAGHPLSDSERGHGDFCVFCLPLLHAGVSLPALAFILAPTIHTDVPTPAFEEIRVVPVRLVSAASPRAPPRLSP
jgi:hypothetical protein